MAACVYIFKCADGSYYVGCTTNLDQRIGQHGDGTFGGWTSARRPLELVWTNEFQYIDDAIAFEQRIKRWSRAKKLALIKGDLAGLKELAGCRATRATN